MKVSEFLTKSVPVIKETETVGFASRFLIESEFDNYDHIYLIDDNKHLVGQVPLKNLVRVVSNTEFPLTKLKGATPVEVLPNEKAERVALLAIEKHNADVAVVDAEHKFIGAVPVEKLLAFLHKKHINNFFRQGGIGIKHHFLLKTPKLHQAVLARLPWLILGLFGGILTSGLVSVFERSLEREISLLFFLPLIVYISDAVGTQTETLLIRRIATRKVSAAKQILHESVTGLLIGIIIGLLATLTLYLCWNKFMLGIVVGLAVTSSTVTSALIASSLPIFLSAIKVDPAAASGPIATIIQDFISVTIYLGIASFILF